MLVVEPSALRFEEGGAEGGPHGEYLLERLSALENRFVRMAERLEQVLDIMLRQARTSYLDHILVETLIDVLAEAGAVDRDRVLTAWRDRGDRESEEAARGARRAKLKERVLAGYRGAERETFARLVEEGFGFLGDDAQRAVRVLEKAAALAPDDAPLNLLLGEHFFRAGRGALARDYLERALAEPDAEAPGRAPLLLGLLRADEGDAARARGLLEEAVRAGGPSFAAHFALGRLRFDEGDAKGALDEFKRALRARPCAEAHYVVGAVSYLAGRARAALRHLSKSVELDPRYAAAQYALGVVRLSLGERAAAAEAFEAARQADPRDPRYAAARRLGGRGRRVPELEPFGPPAGARRRLLAGGDERLTLLLQRDALEGGPGALTAAPRTL